MWQTCHQKALLWLPSFNRVTWSNLESVQLSGFTGHFTGEQWKKTQVPQWHPLFTAWQTCLSQRYFTCQNNIPRAIRIEIFFTWYFDWSFLEFCNLPLLAPERHYWMIWFSIIKKTSSGNYCRWPHCQVKQYYSALNHGKHDRWSDAQKTQSKFYSSFPWK